MAMYLHGLNHGHMYTRTQPPGNHPKHPFRGKKVSDAGYVPRKHVAPPAREEAEPLQCYIAVNVLVKCSRHRKKKKIQNFVQRFGKHTMRIAIWNDCRNADRLCTATMVGESIRP